MQGFGTFPSDTNGSNLSDAEMQDTPMDASEDEMSTEKQSNTNVNETEPPTAKAFLSAFSATPMTSLKGNSDKLQSEGGKVVFPGMTIPLNSNIRTRIGRGLLQHNKMVVASKCGILRSHNKSSKQQSLWLENSQKKYEPSTDDLVVGTVVEKKAEEYILDLGATKYGRLPFLAFEGATARNRPRIETGSLIYARVNFVCKDMDTEVTCTSDYIKRDWITGENLFGELKGGYCFKTSIKLANELMDEECLVLLCLANYVPFEIAVGMNGRIWVNSKQPLHTILICNSILNSEHMNEDMTIAMVRTLFDTVHNA